METENLLAEKISDVVSDFRKEAARSDIGPIVSDIKTALKEQNVRVGNIEDRIQSSNEQEKETTRSLTKISDSLERLLTAQNDILKTLKDTNKDVTLVRDNIEGDQGGLGIGGLLGVGALGLAGVSIASSTLGSGGGATTSGRLGSGAGSTTGGGAESGVGGISGLSGVSPISRTGVGSPASTGQQGLYTGDLNNAADLMLRSIMVAETGSEGGVLDENRYIFTRVTPSQNQGRHSSAYGPVQMTRTFLQDFLNREGESLPDEERGYLDRLIEQGERMLSGVRRGELRDPIYGYGGRGVMGDTLRERQLYAQIAQRAIVSLANRSSSYENFIRRFRGEEDRTYFSRIANTALENYGITPQQLFEQLRGMRPEDVPSLPSISPNGGINEYGESEGLTSEQLVTALANDDDGKITLESLPEGVSVGENSFTTSGGEIINFEVLETEGGLVAQLIDRENIESLDFEGATSSLPPIISPDLQPEDEQPVTSDETSEEVTRSGGLTSSQPPEPQTPLETTPHHINWWRKVNDFYDVSIRTA